jgi:proteasome accessory factor C
MIKSGKPKKISKGKDDGIIPQARLLRLLQIIALLKSSHWSIEQLSKRVDMHKRSIYRYLKLLEAVDFNVDKDFQDRYFIFTSEDESSATQFSVDETHILKQLIQTEIHKNPLKASLLKKLSLNSELDGMPGLIIKMRNGKMVEKLSGAIKEKKQVILSSYHSANSNDVRDRLIEPISFGDNYLTLLALDTADKKCKQFKTERIGEVIVHNELFKFEKYHQKDVADMFGMMGATTMVVTLNLKMRAYLLLREDFPLAIPYLEKTDENHWQFQGPVKNYEGLGRFVLGLPDEIIIISPPDFKEFIETRLKNQVLFKTV